MNKRFCCFWFLCLLVFLCACGEQREQNPVSEASVAGTTENTDADFAPTLADFSDIIPGKSTIGDLFEKLPYKTGKGFFRELRYVEYEDKNGDIFCVKYDDKGVIQSVSYTMVNLPSDDSEATIPDETLPEPEYVKEALTLKDFEHIVLGESDFFDLYRIYPERSAGAISSAHALFEYPAEDGNAIYVKIWDNLKVISIEYTVARR